MKDFDVAIVGAGFAGALLAMIAQRVGRSVVLLERGTHPRFAIGESSTPLANLLLQQLSDQYELPRVRPLSKWGSWQRHYPEIPCGRKRGFSFFHHSSGEAFKPDPEHTGQLLVAASPSDELADTHWYRPKFDHFLVREATANGVEYLDRTNLTGLSFEPGAIHLEGERLGRPFRAKTELLIDASGPRGFLHRSLGLAELPLTLMPQTQALFSHFTGVSHFQEVAGMKEAKTPYPIDDAALHHVFDGGWVWVLPFNNGLTSAGIAATENLARHLKPATGESAWKRLLQRFPTIEAQFANAEAQLPFMHMPQIGFRSAMVSGSNWALLPSAAGFIDPLLSTGFTLTLLGVARLARIIAEDWSSPRSRSLQTYAQQTTAELLVVERLVAALYASMHDFASFRLLSLLYFAPVSFAEIAHRLGRSTLASSFLLAEEPRFGPRSKQLLNDAMALLGRGRKLSDSPSFSEQLLETIAPFDLIGLSDPERKSWYPAEDEDLMRSAWKLGVNEADVKTFVRCSE